MKTNRVRAARSAANRNRQNRIQAALEQLEVRQLLTTYFVNFTSGPGGQPANQAPVDVPGYMTDIGTGYGDRTDRGNAGFQYGWVEPGTAIPNDNELNARNRNDPAAPSELWDSFNHLQKPVAESGPANWEFGGAAGLSGQYVVGVGSADLGGAVDANYNIHVEGVRALGPFVPTADAILYGTALVNITDGRLTVTPGPSSANDKIAFIEISNEAPTQAPVSLDAVGGPASVRLTWPGSQFASAFNIYRGTTSGSLTLLTSNVSGTTYDDNTAVPDQTYFYAVRGANPFGEGPASPEASATAINAAPDTPQNFEARGVAAPLRTLLSWTASSGAAAYDVYRGPSSGSLVLLQANVTGTSFTDSAVALGQTYVYHVIARNVTGSAAPTSEVTVSFTGAYTQFMHGTTGNIFNLTGPVAYSRLDPNINYSWGTGSPSNTLVPPGLNISNAVNADNFTSLFTGKIVIDAPGTYTFVTNTDDSGRAWVNGQLVSNDTAAAGHGLQDAPAANRFPITFAAAGQYPFVMLQADGTGGSGAIFKWITPGGSLIEIPADKLIPDVIPVATPTNLTGTAGPITIGLSWTDNALNEAYYRIEMSTDGGTTWSPANIAAQPDMQGLGWVTAVSNPGATGAPATSPTYTVSGLAPSTEYKFRVIAGNKIEEKISNIFTVSTQTVPPGGITVTPTISTGDTNLTNEGSLDWVHWGNPNSATGFNGKYTGSANAVLQTGNGTLMWEAEIFDQVTDPDGDGRVWRALDNSGTPTASDGTNAASGDQALFADIPVNGQPFTESWVWYTVQITTPGTYRLYYRNYVADLDGGGLTNNDSVFLPPNGGPITAEPGGPTGANHARSNAAYGWANSNFNYTIAQPGFYTFRMGAREGGYIIDRVALSLTNNLSGATLDGTVNSTRGVPQRGPVQGPITNFTKIGTGTVTAVDLTGKTFTWTNGAPAASVPATNDAVSISGVGSGFEFSVPASSQSRRLRLYVGANNAVGRLTASFSDGSVAPTQTTIDATGTSTFRVVEYDFRSGLENQTLTIRYEITSGAGSIQLAAASWVEYQIPANPTGFTATASGSSHVDLVWNDVTLETGYTLEIANDAAFTSIISTVNLPVNTTTFTDGLLPGGTTRHYRLKANNAGGNQGGVTSTATTAPSNLPAPWQRTDIGVTAPRYGDSIYDAGTQTFNTQGSGADIFGNADGGHFVYQQLTGDWQITAKVLSNQSIGGATDNNAKVGVMFRDSLAAGAREAAVFTTFNQNIKFQFRQTTDGASTGGAANAVQPPTAFYPAYVRLRKVGQFFTGLWSTDGINFTVVGTGVDFAGALPDTLFVGLANTAHNTGRDNIGAFTEVSIAPIDPNGPTVIGITMDSPLPASVSYTSASTVAVQFSENVAATIDGGDLQITDSQFNGISLNFHGYDNATNTAYFTFNTSNPGLAAGELIDGNYNLYISAGSVSDTDGNLLRGDGTNNGSNYDPAGSEFYKYRGDTQRNPNGTVNADRRVSFTDFQTLERNQGKVNPSASEGDFNYDGVINNLDFNILFTRMNTTLPAPAAPAPAVAPKAPAKPVTTVTKTPVKKPAAIITPTRVAPVVKPAAPSFSTKKIATIKELLK